MGYIENNLIKGEMVIHRATLHWIIFLWPITWLIIALPFFTQSYNVAIIGVFILLIAIIQSVRAFILLKTSEFGITDKRVIMKTGFIRRDSFEILLTKIEGIQVNQGIIERILGYGSIAIVGTGGSENPFSKISCPLEFRKIAQEQITLIQ